MVDNDDRKKERVGGKGKEERGMKHSEEQKGRQPKG